jgi:hypothetical protein
VIGLKYVIVSLCKKTVLENSIKPNPAGYPVTSRIRFVLSQSNINCVNLSILVVRTGNTYNQSDFVDETSDKGFKY